MRLSARGLAALIVVVILFVVGMVAFNAITDNIKPGYVGYVYDRTLNPGDPRAIPGTSVYTTPKYGFVVLNPWTQEVLKYRASITARNWTANDEGKKGVDESMELGTIEGQNAKVDVYLSVKPHDISKIISNFGMKDFDAIVDQDLYGLIKGKMATVTRGVSIYDIQKEGANIQKKSFEIIDQNLKDTYGIELVRLEIGKVLPPKEIQEKINAKTSAQNEVDLAELARQKQDKVNQQSVDKQIADSKVTLTKRQQDADASAYEVLKQAEAQKTAAEAKLVAARLEKEAELERQQTYTDSYLKNKQLDVQKAAVESINKDLKVIIDSGDGTGIGSIAGIKAILDEINKPSK